MPNYRYNLEKHSDNFSEGKKYQSVFLCDDIDKMMDKYISELEIAPDCDHYRLVDGETGQILYSDEDM